MHNHRWIRAGLLLFVLGVLTLSPAFAETTVIDFEGLPDQVLVYGQFVDLGVTFSGSGARILTCGVSLNCPTFPPFSGDKVLSDYPRCGGSGGEITAIFDLSKTGNVRSVSARVTGNHNITMKAFTTAGAIVDFTQTGGCNCQSPGCSCWRSPNLLLAVESAGGPIKRVTFADHGNSYTIDDLTFSASPAPEEEDADLDGIHDDYDNCPQDFNPSQTDSDYDGLGNSCDACALDALNDIDGDGFCGDVDNCPVHSNPDQGDWDANGVGDACDDYDGDDVVDSNDNCVAHYNPTQEDLDNDGLGVPCDPCAGTEEIARIRAAGRCGFLNGVKTPTGPVLAEWDWGSHLTVATELTFNSGEKLEFHCVDGAVPYYALFYSNPHLQEPVRVGLCPWKHGCNVRWFYYAGDRVDKDRQPAPNGDGTPDCLHGTMWISRDYGNNDERLGDQCGNQWGGPCEDINQDGMLQSTENKLDWAKTKFVAPIKTPDGVPEPPAEGEQDCDLHPQNCLTKIDRKYDYVWGPPVGTNDNDIQSACRNTHPNGRPEGDRRLQLDVTATVTDPPIGPQTEAFFDNVVEDLQILAGDAPGFMADGPSVLCDLDDDLDCDEDDVQYYQSILGTCLEDIGYDPMADIDGSGCIDAEDQVFLFEKDDDLDGIPDSGDNCPFPNPDQTDTDNDGVGDLCDLAIDIKPGSDPNCFNNNGHGVIPVAILTTSYFDATQVDPLSISLDSLGVRVVGNGNIQAQIEDVNEDGLDDLMLQIEDVDGVYEEGDAMATLTGETFDGIRVMGHDSICIVP